MDAFGDADLATTEAAASVKQALLARGPLPDEEWRHFIAAARSVNLAPKDKYVSPGEQGGGFAFVVRGLMKRYFNTRDGDVFIMSFACEGEFVSDFSALLRGAATDIYVEAITSTTLLSWPPEFAIALRERHLCWQNYGRVLAEERYLQKAARERSLLGLNATDRWLELMEQNPWWLSVVSQKDVASYLGITEVSLSRIRRSL